MTSRSSRFLFCDGKIHNIIRKYNNPENTQREKNKQKETERERERDREKVRALKPLTSKIIKILLFSLGGQLFRCLLLSHERIWLILGQLFNNFLLLLYIVLKNNKDKKKLTNNSMSFYSTFQVEILFIFPFLLKKRNFKSSIRVFIFKLTTFVCLFACFI